MTFKFFPPPVCLPGFPRDALRALCAALRPSVAELPRGRVLWRMGEQVTQAGIVLSGRVEAWHYTAAGGRPIWPRCMARGGVFGDVLMSAQTVGSLVELRTAADSRVFFSRLRRCLRSARAAARTVRGCWKNLLREVSEKYWRLQRRVQCLSIPDGRRRLAFYLCAQGAEDFLLPISGNRWPGSSA